MSLGLHCRNLILGILCFNIPNIVVLRGLMGSISQFNLGDPRSFPEKTGNKFAFLL